MRFRYGLLAAIVSAFGGGADASPPVVSAGAGPIRCVSGLAGAYTCSDLHLLSQLDLGELGVTDPGTKGSDHWGWTDASTGRQFVIVGLMDQTVFVEITDPENPVFLGTLPSHDGASVWRDIKTYADYAFIVGDIPTAHGLQVFDLRRLRHVVAPPVVFSEDVHYDGFGPGHNLWVNELTGHLYVFRSDTCGGGVHMVDITDPMAPAFAGCFAESDAPLSDGECVVYTGPDGDHHGREVCFIGSDDNVMIGDVTDKGRPTVISSFTYPGIQRAHQGALSPDQRYWLLSDTMDEANNGHPTRTYIVDVSDLDSPAVLGSHTHATNARDHNLYIVGETVYQTNWKAGLRLLDIGDLPSTTFTEIGFFDTDPSSDSVAVAGAWSNYPWWRDGVVTVSDTDQGLLVLGPTMWIDESTYLGGEMSDRGYSIATDDSGYTYVAGATQSPSFPDSFEGGHARHGVDAFVAKLAPQGQAAYVIWVNAQSAFAEDEGFDIATDGSGNAYVTGMTNSSDFCAFFGAVPGFDTTYNGNGDAFVFKVNDDGSAVDYCTYLGGNDWDTGRGIAVAPNGVATVTGGTWSTDFPATAGAYAENLAGSRDSFVARLDPTGTNLVFATYLGGSGQEEGRDVALASDNEVVVTGWTASADFPTTPGALAPGPAGDFDGFVTRLRSSASSLRFSTYLGGASEDRGNAVALDAFDRAVVAGITVSDNFPVTPGAFDESHGGLTDGFVTFLDPEGTALVSSTFVGGANQDWVYDVALNGAGQATVVGETWSADFPTSTRASSVDLQGGRDAFVLQLSAASDTMTSGTLLGGSDWDDGRAVAHSKDGWVVVTGATRSTDFPTTQGAVDPDHNGDYDVFVTRLPVSSGIANVMFVNGFESGDVDAWSSGTP